MRYAISPTCTGNSLDLTVDNSSQFASEEVSAIAVANGKLILGTESGKLFTADFANSGELGHDFKQIVPQEHRSGIRSIKVHPNGMLLTVADEPVVHLWALLTNNQIGRTKSS